MHKALLKEYGDDAKHDDEQHINAQPLQCGESQRPLSRYGGGPYKRGRTDQNQTDQWTSDHIASVA